MKKNHPGRMLVPLLCLAAALLALAFFAGRMSLHGLRVETQRAAAPEEQAVRSLPEEETSAEPRRDRLDLNSATREELVALPGIGEALADRILAYRQTYGPFTDVSQLMDVSGIGEIKFLAIRDAICVEDSYEDSGSGR